MVLSIKWRSNLKATIDFLIFKLHSLKKQRNAIYTMYGNREDYEYIVRCVL